MLLQFLLGGLSWIPQHLSWRRLLVFYVVDILHVPIRTVIGRERPFHHLKVFLPEDVIICNFFWQRICGAARGYRRLNPHWGSKQAVGEFPIIQALIVFIICA